MTHPSLHSALRGASIVALACAAGLAVADSDRRNDTSVRSRLGGFQEVPVVSTTGSGSFKGQIDRSTGEIDYEFSYADLQGTVTQAHIHLGQQGVNGGIMVWLCQ